MSSARDLDLDIVIAQRPKELFELAPRWLNRRLGSELPCIYLEHNAPGGRVNSMRHPVRDRNDLFLVHVTHFNALFWDSGSTPTTVIEHGIVDPGLQYTGDVVRAGVVVNEPLRRGRTVGLDLMTQLGRELPLDIFGMKTQALGGTALTQACLHHELSKRRAYLHLTRWTSLGLSLIEAMHLGMPIVALATTEIPESVPPDAGVVSNRLEVLEKAIRNFLCDRQAATDAGLRARKAALDRFGLRRFLDDWEGVLMKAIS